MAQPFVLDVNLRIQDVIGLEKVKAALAQTGGSTGVGGGKGGAKKSGGGGGSVPPGGAGAMSSESAQETAKSFEQVAVAADKASKSTSNVGKSSRQAASSLKAAGQSAQGFGEKMKIAGVRYAAFVAATAIPFAMIAAFKNATESVIEFDTALVKMSQIMDTTKAELADLGQSMIKLSTETGTSLTEIAKSAKVLTQAGFRENLEGMLEPLSKIPLLASFESIEQATEGVIATINQFGIEAGNATDILDRFDHVSNKFAVTASDLVEGIKRGGGAFAALGGNINEFIALMTVMRATTRESASTIGTSIRTITARMARPATINFLEGLGVVVRDAEGELLGLLEILSNLFEVFDKSGTEGKAKIGEMLGGFRQISRVLAAIKNPTEIKKALAESEKASGSIAKNAEKGLESISAQLNILGTRWIEFVQTLAEPIFIPLIKGATGFFNVVVDVMSALGPILPLLTKLVGFAAGVAALAKSFSLVAAAAKATSTAFAAAGAAGAGLLSKGAGLANAAGGAAAGGGMAARNAARSRVGLGAAGAAGGAAAAGGGGKFGQMPQLAAATGLYYIMETLGKHAEEVGNEFGILSTEVVKTATAFVIAASLLRKQSIGEMGKGLAGYAKGAGLMGKIGLGASAVAATLSAAGLAAAKNANINIDKLVKKAADHINDLDFEVNDEASLDKMGGEVANSLRETIDAASEEYSGLVGALAQFGERMGAALRSAGSLIGASEADWGTAFGTTDIIDEEKVKEMFTAMYEASPKKYRAMLDQAIKEAGPNYRDALLESFAGSLPEGTDPRYAELLRNWLIELTGGEKQAQTKVSKQLGLAAQQRFAQETDRVVEQLKKVVVPSQLVHQMNKFGYALNEVTQELNNSSSSFRALAGNIGQISAPQIPTEMSLEGIEKNLGDLGLQKMLPDFDLSEFGELGEAAQVTQQVSQLMNQLLDDLNATEASTKTQSDLENVRQDASKAIETALSSFWQKFEGQFPEKHKAAVRRTLEQTAKEWQSAIETGMQPDPESLEKALGDIMGSLSIPTEGLAQQLQEAMGSLLDQVNAQMEHQAGVMNLDIGGTQTAEKVLNDFNGAMKSIGQSGIEWQGDMESTAASFGQYGNQIRALGTAISDLETERTSKFKELTKAVKEGSPDALRLAQEFLKLNSKMNELQGHGVQQAMKMINEAREALQEKAGTDIGELQERYPSADVSQQTDQINQKLKEDMDQLDKMSEYLTSTIKVDQLNAVASGAEIYKKATGDFVDAVKSFQAAVNDLSGKKDAGDTPGARGADGELADKDSQVETLDIPPGEVVIDHEGKMTPKEDPSTPAELDRQDMQGLGAPLEDTIGELKAAMLDEKSFAQNAADSIAFLGGTAAEMIANLGGLDNISSEIADVVDSALTKSDDYSEAQIDAAIAAIVQKRREEATGSGTGADLNTDENLTANLKEVVNAIKQGREPNRDKFEYSPASQMKIDNQDMADRNSRQIAEEAARKAAEAQIKAGKEQQDRGYTDEQLRKAIKEAQETGGRAKVGEAPPPVEKEPTQTASAQQKGGMFPPGFAGIGQALAAAALGATTGLQEPTDTTEDTAVDQREAASMMQAAAETNTSSSDTMLKGATEIAAGGDNMLSSAKAMEGIGDSGKAMDDAVSKFDNAVSESNAAPEAMAAGIEEFKGSIGEMAGSAEAIAGAADNLSNVEDISSTLNAAGETVAAGGELMSTGAQEFQAGVGEMTSSVEGIKDAAAGFDRVGEAADGFMTASEIASENSKQISAGMDNFQEGAASFKNSTDGLQAIGDTVDGLEAASEAASTQNDVLAQGATNIQTGGDNILAAAETLRASVESLGMTPGMIPTGDLSTPSMGALDAATGTSEDMADLGADVDSQMGTESIRMSAENMLLVSEMFSESINRFTASNESIMMAHETFRTSTDSFRMSVESIISSVDILRGVSDTMQAVIDTQNQGQVDPASGGMAEGDAEAGNQRMSEAIESLGERMDAVTEAVGLQTQQDAELAAAKETEPLVVEGLDDNTDAIAANSDIAGKTQEEMSGLNEGMSKAAAAMEEGIGIDIETMSNVKVDVAGVGQAAKEFTSEFEAVAHRVAKEEIRAVLQELARSAGSSEASDAFEGAM